MFDLNATSEAVEFKPWPKIPRGSKGEKVIITEKMDGTNACIVIVDGKIVAVQSRKRFITPEDDNYGFARWVEENAEELVKLGDGYHYGEWCGGKIQGNPHNIMDKKFFLFNTARWGEHNPNTPSCCKVVRVLYSGEYYEGLIDAEMCKLKDYAHACGYLAEGVVAFFPKANRMEKHTFKFSQGKWRGDA